MLAVFISDFALVFVMTPKNKQAFMAKLLVIIALAIAAALLTSFSLASVASAQQQSGSKFSHTPSIKKTDEVE